MEKTLPLYLGPSVIGSAVISDDGKNLSLSATTYASIDGICRAYVRGDGGELLVGVLSPDGRRFSAKKTVSPSSLSAARLSFDRITYAFVSRTDEQIAEEKFFRFRGDIPELLLRDKTICALARASGTLTDNPTAPTKLAIPLFTGLPFPRPDILCLLTPRKIGDSFYGILGISEKGAPIRL